ncbi:DUF805 domain-containing protein [Gymnodinialimonas ceratoperidinii]|uniref:DUF805 domain-containing protein n=1 Tax=Gymnodinialimonas ceratoperidinii TaxID=2856823 RepID=A0A8F6TZ01_9RHOB|nr:DUF805 domain-containing protein [Gymnodinialimonas ceratoperidinii]QXT40337.1 DUF805 domain-containing protein [Gymnodinialimonas ceratoperidinii]
MLHFSGRARRSEFWWFALWTVLANFAFGAAAGYYAFSNPEIMAEFQQAKTFGAPDAAMVEQLRYYTGYYVAAQLILFWLPGLAVTIRRLHDTDRSGAWYFIQLVPLIGAIWFLVLMCLPGTYGNNRFGDDSAPDRKVPTPSHPAFAGELKGKARAEAESARRAEAKEYYRRHVLPSIQRA